MTDESSCRLTGIAYTSNHAPSSNGTLKVLVEASFNEPTNHLAGSELIEERLVVVNISHNTGWLAHYWR
jgi:hypothetical protein